MALGTSGHDGFLWMQVLRQRFLRGNYRLEAEICGRKEEIARIRSREKSTHNASLESINQSYGDLRIQ